MMSFYEDELISHNKTNKDKEELLYIYRSDAEDWKYKKRRQRLSHDTFFFLNIGFQLMTESVDYRIHGNS